MTRYHVNSGPDLLPKVSLNAERKRVVGEGDMDNVLRLVARGVQPGFYEQAAAIVTEQHPDQARSGARLAEILVAVVPFSLEEAFTWLRTIAAAPDFQAARNSLIKTPTGDPDAGAPILRWRDMLRGPGASLAPLAWAAGLTPQETRDRYRAGTLTETGLRIMAGLRDFRL